MKLNEIVSPQTVAELARASGVETPQAEKLIKEAVPILMESMHKNASSADGAESLAHALKQHAASSADSKLSGVDVEDGNKILAHVLGADQKKVSKQLSKATGIKNNKTTLLLALLAPLLLNALGNTAEQTNTNSANGMGSLLGTLLGLGGNTSSGNDGMGSLLTSLLGMGSGSSSYSNNNSGSLLGSLFGLGGNSNSHSNNNNNSGDLLGTLLTSALSAESGNSNNAQTPVAQTLTNELGGGSQGNGLAGMLIDLLSGK